MLTGCQKDRTTCQKTDRQKDLVIKTKVVQNVNRKSERQTDRPKRPIDRQTRVGHFMNYLFFWYSNNSGSKQMLFRMSTGCQKRQTDRQED